MKEKIILAPGARASELLRTLARFGVNTLGLRIVNGIELSKIALMKSGVSVTEKFLPAGDEAAVIYSFLNGIPYFDSASYADAENLAAALRTLGGLAKAYERSYIKEKLANGEFQEKNDAIVLVYEKFIEAVKKDGLIDGIGLIRRALSEAAPFDAEFMSVSEFPLTMLEEELLSHVSGGAFKTLSLLELFGKEKAKGRELSYMEGYGGINEAEDILSHILEDRIPLDQSLIVCANTSSYIQMFYDLSCQYGIPVSFGSGVPITNSYPADLLKKLFDWDTTGYHGIDPLRALLRSESFDREKLGKAIGLNGPLQGSELEEVAEMAGNLKISFDKQENDKRLKSLSDVLKGGPERASNKKDKARAERKLEVFPLVEKLSDELSAGICGVLEKYAVIRPEPAGRIDQSALMVLTQGLKAFTEYAPDNNFSEIVTELLKKTVSSESSREGQLHICSVNSAFTSIRQNVFVCGLSASDFPGSPSENYLLLDTDLERFGTDPRIPTSVNRISRKKKELDSLIDLCAGLNIPVRLSYSGYDLAELKEQNPSSVLFSYFEEDHPGHLMDDFRKSVRHAEYFSSALSSSRLAAAAYSRGEEVSFKEKEISFKDTKPAISEAWSPSALEIFFQCPLRFYFTKILKLPENDPDDPFEVISAKDTGTLAHSLMETLANKDTSREVFLKDAADAFDRFLAARRPIHENTAELDKNRFLKMMETAYLQEKEVGNEVLSAEEKYIHTHPTGVKLSGYPDRVEKDKEGRYIIADFKTKRKHEHIKDDIDTCLQVVIYAWLCEQEGIDISRCDYRYIRKNETVTCRYDEDMKDKLSEKLLVFKEALETGSFPKAESKDACRYCRMGDICKKFGSDVEDEDEE